MMLFFQRQLRRANIDIKYSEGYSAHQIMSFAAPLGVGITSDGEYFDIEVLSTESSQKSLDALNAQMVDGVEVTGYVALPEKAKTAMSIVAAADYYLSYKDGYVNPHTIGEWNDIIKTNLLDKSDFIVTKKTKKSEREVDIKPLVYAIKAVELDGKQYFYFKSFYPGSIDNIKPEFVLESLYGKCNIEYDPLAIQIHRNDVFARDESGELISLLEMGEIIS